MAVQPDIPLTVVRPKPVPIGAMLLGRPVEEAAELLPRIFNLCRGAQEVAVRLCFGLPLAKDWRKTLARDVARDHAAKLGVLLPHRLGLATKPLPEDPEAMTRAVLGDSPVPSTAEEFEGFLAGDAGLGPLMRAVDQAFERDGAVKGLDLVSPDTACSAGAVENSVAARHETHPIMRHIAGTRGQGPLWRVAARLLDILAAAKGDFPDPIWQDGKILVPASRGLYAVWGNHDDGDVTEFDRVTPTDHLLAQDGVLDRSLAALPSDKQHLAPLLLDILDPCTPVQLKGGGQDA